MKYPQSAAARPVGIAARMAPLLLLAAGCGSPSSGSSPEAMSPEHMAAMVSPSAAPSSAGTWDTSQLPDPCRTLSEAEVTAALGVGVTRTSNRESWPPLCAYALTGGAEFLYVSDNSQPSGREDFESDKTIANGGQPIATLGDAAFWSPETSALGVMSGKTYVVLKFGGSALPKQAKEKAVALARIAVPRTAA